jgi:hypothetical protein
MSAPEDQARKLIDLSVEDEQHFLINCHNKLEIPWDVCSASMHCHKCYLFDKSEEEKSVGNELHFLIYF